MWHATSGIICEVDETSRVKNIVWIGSSLEDLKKFPDEVKDVMGYALYQAQIGRKAPSAKPLRGFGGASGLEVVEDHKTDTYRAVYTVRFRKAIYVLHAFQKKAKKGIATPKADLELIKTRLRVAADHYSRHQVARG